jgi:ATP-dependent DNA helicase RecG
MCSTNDGFKIAEKDLELRGPGDIQGTRQSGALNFKLANIVDDRGVLDQARADVEQLLTNDSDLTSSDNYPLLMHLKQMRGGQSWSKIS